MGNYLLVGPCSVFFVTLDRLLVLILQLNYTTTVQRRVGYAAVVCMLALYASSVGTVMIAWPYDGACITKGTENNPIANRPCLPLLNKIVDFVLKSVGVAISLLNIAIGVIFVVKLRKAGIRNVVCFCLILIIYIREECPESMKSFRAGEGVQHKCYLS